MTKLNFNYKKLKEWMDDYVEKKLNFINDFGITTSPSGGAGIIALIYATENQLFEINKDSSSLVFLTEDKI